MGLLSEWGEAFVNTNLTIQRDPSRTALYLQINSFPTSYLNHVSDVLCEMNVFFTHFLIIHRFYFTSMHMCTSFVQFLFQRPHLSGLLLNKTCFLFYTRQSISWIVEVAVRGIRFGPMLQAPEKVHSNVASALGIKN